MWLAPIIRTSINMRYTNSPELLAKFPTLTTGLVVIKGLDNQPCAQPDDLLAQAQAQVAAEFEPATLSQHPHISSWRSAYSAFGVKPSKYNCACELLLRRVLKDGALPRINKLVDLCNCISLKYVLPVAAYDLTGITGDLTVTLAQGKERFLPLNTDQWEEAEPGEVIYKDQEKALSRRWNWRQCDQAKATPATRDALLTLEGVNHIGPDVVVQATTELADLVERFCSHPPRRFILTNDNPQAEF